MIISAHYILIVLPAILSSLIALHYTAVEAIEGKSRQRQIDNLYLYYIYIIVVMQCNLMANAIYIKPDYFTYVLRSRCLNFLHLHVVYTLPSSVSDGAVCFGGELSE